MNLHNSFIQSLYPKGGNARTRINDLSKLNISWVAYSRFVVKKIKNDPFRAFNDIVSVIF